MPMYRVIKTFQYTEEIEIDADTPEAAKAAAMELEGMRIHDDSLVDIAATAVKSKVVGCNHESK